MKISKFHHNSYFYKIFRKREKIRIQLNSNCVLYFVFDLTNFLKGLSWLHHKRCLIF